MVNITNVQLNGRFEDKTQTKPIRATLYHIDGTTSVIELNVPRYSTWSDYEENACMILKEYCNILAAHWVQIYKFSIQSGEYDEQGNFESYATYQDNHIPEGKVFVRGNFGEWVNFAAAYAADVEAQCVALERRGL
ncbi:hypothetical protein [Pedobacter sp. Leaf170]|uniref:hypothetical protein n=1 Tax=Pedobacter sp. Leaf170 TaxID=2876558 RepID=UPI001E5E8412|nr:hypothetical protein [Pedobacter sp. Leaf170]